MIVYEGSTQEGYPYSGRIFGDSARGLTESAIVAWEKSIQNVVGLTSVRITNVVEMEG